MALVIDNAFLPATLTGYPMTDDEFTAFCAEYPDLFFEMTADSEIIVMAPAYSLMGARNSIITCRLGTWSKDNGQGIVCGPSAGFVLPNGARRSADASWTLRSRVAELDSIVLEKYWRLCPDFVIELQSSTDRPRVLANKMQEWMANGAQLGWLIDPDNRSVAIYRPNGDVETRTDIDSVAGEGLLTGFVLELAAVWNPLGS